MFTTSGTPTDRQFFTLTRAYHAAGREKCGIDAGAIDERAIPALRIPEAEASSPGVHSDLEVNSGSCGSASPAGEVAPSERQDAGGASPIVSGWPLLPSSSVIWC
jgi:hypothetical protein